MPTHYLTFKAKRNTQKEHEGISYIYTHPKYVLLLVTSPMFWDVVWRLLNSFSQNHTNKESKKKDHKCNKLLFIDKW